MGRVLFLLIFAACAAGRPGAPIVVSAQAAPQKPVQNAAVLPVNNIFLAGASLESEEVFQRLVTQLRSEDAAKRTCAATDLGFLRLDRRQLIPPLVFALKHDVSKWVRRAAAKALGRIGSREVITPLTEALNDSDRWVAHSAANALAALPREFRRM